VEAKQFYFLVTRSFCFIEIITCIGKNTSFLIVVNKLQDLNQGNKILHAFVALQVFEILDFKQIDPFQMQTI